MRKDSVLTGGSSSGALGGELLLSEEATKAAGSMSERASAPATALACVSRCFAIVFSRSFTLACSS